jgi:hypothetical protein
MAAPAKTYAKFISVLDSIVHNPSRRFLSEQDYLNYSNMAVLETALAVGGLNLIDTTVLSVAGTRDYVLNDQYKKIKKAQYITGIGTAAESAVPVEVITQSDQDYLSRAALPDALTDATEPVRYLIFWPETATVRLVGAPTVTGDTLKLWVIGTPAELSSTVTYDGDQMETMAIVYKMAALARLKSRETGESTIFDNKFEESCDKIRRMRSKMRQVRQIQDGRFFHNRLRSVNGAK